MVELIKAISAAISENGLMAFVVVALLLFVGVSCWKLIKFLSSGMTKAQDQVLQSMQDRIDSYESKISSCEKTSKDLYKKVQDFSVKNAEIRAERDQLKAELSELKRAYERQEIRIIDAINRSNAAIRASAVLPDIVQDRQDAD